MENIPIVILIEDEDEWKNDLEELILQNFPVKVEAYGNFTEGENRIIKGINDFALLITDIFPGEAYKDFKGLEFVKIVKKLKQKPVIVVTAASHLINIVLNDYDANNAFDKGEFNPSGFINAVANALDPSNPLYGKAIRNPQMPKGPNKFTFG